MTANENTFASDTSAPAPLLPHTVTLETPIQRRPLSGELRGLSLASLLQLDVANLQMLLPRITSPMLTRAEIDQLDPADLVQLGVEVTGFFLTKADRLPLSPTA